MDRKVGYFTKYNSAAFSWLGFSHFGDANVDVRAELLEGRLAPAGSNAMDDVVYFWANRRR